MPCHSVQQGRGCPTAELPICRTGLYLPFSVDAAGSVIPDESVLPSVTALQRPVSSSWEGREGKKISEYYFCRSFCFWKAYSVQDIYVITLEIPYTFSFQNKEQVQAIFSFL